MDRNVVILIVRIVIFALLGGLVFAVYMGRREMISANQLPFFQIKRQRVVRGLRFIFLGIFLGVVAIGLQIFGLNAVERLIPAATTPQVAGLPEQSATAVRSTTPTGPALDTATASITPSPTERGTPALPQGVIALFEESVTPDARAVFGPIHVATELIYPAYPDDEEFESAEGILYGLFSYDYLEPGVRWTAVWLWEDEIACVETKPWDSERGGWGYTECELDQWPVGEYFIHMFLGEEWMVSGQFTVLSMSELPEQDETLTPTTSP